MACIYSYLIGWSKHNKWYYGVRYSNTAVYGDIWKTYFTSSKTVHLLREIVGEPDVVKVRRVFNSPEEAQRWEQKLLTRINAASDPNWLNQTNGGGGCNIPPKHNNKIWINNGTKNRRIYPAIFESFKKRGWKKGRILYGESKFYEHGNRKRCPETGRFMSSKKEK